MWNILKSLGFGCNNNDTNNVDIFDKYEEDGPIILYYMFCEQVKINPNSIDSFATYIREFPERYDNLNKWCKKHNVTLNKNMLLNIPK